MASVAQPSVPQLYYFFRTKFIRSMRLVNDEEIKKC